MDFPVIVDLAIDVEEEFFLPPGIVVRVARHGLLREDAAPLDIVGMLFEVGDADAEILEFIRELRCQLVNRRLVGC